MLKKSLLGLLLFFYTCCIFAATISAESVAKATASWATALSARDPQKITLLYDNKAYLYATYQNMIDNQKGIENYFKKLMQHQNLAVTFNKENIRLYGETAINSGLYTFSYDENGKHVAIPARFTFVYTLTPTGWMIVEHHSSVLPDS